MHIATLGFYLILMVFAVLSIRAAIAGKQNAAKNAMIIAQLNANILAALKYCDKHEVSSDSVHCFCTKCRPSLFLDHYADHLLQRTCRTVARYFYTAAR